jgi:hypothetical protein
MIVLDPDEVRGRGGLRDQPGRFRVHLLIHACRRAHH